MAPVQLQCARRLRDRRQTGLWGSGCDQQRAAACHDTKLMRAPDLHAKVLRALSASSAADVARAGRSAQSPITHRGSARAPAAPAARRRAVGAPASGRRPSAPQAPPSLAEHCSCLGTTYHSSPKSFSDHSEWRHSHQSLHQSAQGTRRSGPAVPRLHHEPERLARERGPRASQTIPRPLHQSLHQGAQATRRPAPAAPRLHHEPERLARERGALGAGRGLRALQQAAGAVECAVGVLEPGAAAGAQRRGQVLRAAACAGHSLGLG